MTQCGSGQHCVCLVLAHHPPSHLPPRSCHPSSRLSVGCLFFASIALAVVIITFLAASLIEVFENDRERFPRHVSLARQETSLTFLDCQYFVLVTIATIG